MQTAEYSDYFRLRTELAKIEVGRLTADWCAGPPVTVVPSVADLPVAVPADVVGLFYRRKVFIVAAQPRDRLGRVLAHEAFGHFGLRKALGRVGWRRFMLAVHTAARKGGDTFLRGLHGKVKSLYGNDRGKTELRPVQQADELVSAYAEDAFDPRSGRLLVHDPVLKQAEAVVGHLAREYLRLDVPVCSRQVEGMLLYSEHTLRYGGAFWGAGFRLKRLYQALAVLVGVLGIWSLGTLV